MRRPSRGDEVRATTAGEVGRARERACQLAATLHALSDAATDAVQLPLDDLEGMVARLQAVTLSGLLAMNDLSAIAGRLSALSAVRRDW